LAREEAEAQAARELDVPAFLDRRRFPHERDAEPYVYAIGYLFTPTLKGITITVSPENTGQKQSTQFQPGESGNPAGRPKGARNKLSENFLTALAEDFEANGKQVIEKVRTERPHEYLKVVASIMPRQQQSLEMKITKRAEVTDDELATIAAQATLRTAAT
jgi:hypothetical protein